MNRPAVVFERPGIPDGVRPVPGGLRRGQESHRGRGRDREVDGLGGEAVKDEAVLMFFVAGSVLIFLVAFGVGFVLAVSP
jgi:hypothetical protein